MNCDSVSCKGHCKYSYFRFKKQYLDLFFERILKKFVLLIFLFVILQKVIEVAMRKPDDYNKYFNEDGTRKKSPYDFHDKRDGEWMDRQTEIFLSLMSDGERNEYLSAMRNMGDKMQSSVGGTVFHS